MPCQQHAVRVVRQVAHDILQGGGRGEIDAPVPARLDRLTIAFEESVQRLRDADGRGCDQHVEVHGPLRREIAHQSCGLFPPPVEGALKIAGDRVVPVRFGMAQQGQPLHHLSCQGQAGFDSPCPKAAGRPRGSLCACWLTAMIASSSVNRRTGVPGGKALSNRLGIAADRITKQPLSSARRMSRPKACASRARISRSS